MVLYGVVAACFVLGIFLGFVGGHYRAVDLWRADVRRLEDALEEMALQAGKAAIDTRLVQGLRAGDIGLDDLRELGFEEVRQEATGAKLGKSEYQAFEPRLYRRNLSRVSDMAAGDEVWIHLGLLEHDLNGNPVLRWDTPCSPCSETGRRARLRCFATPRGLAYELAVDPKDPAPASGAVCFTDSLRIGFVTVLRPEDRYQKS